jgi:hypothetical protein
MLAVAAGCGSPGVPEPPSLELARPVRDLKAFRKGDEVHLNWSVSTETTDHHIFRHAGAMQICRGLGQALHTCGTPVTEQTTPTLSDSQKSGKVHNHSAGRSPNPQASYTDHLSPTLEMQSPASNLVYAVNILNSYGKSAGLSNQVRVPSAPTLPAPSGFGAKLTSQGVNLTWTPVSVPPEIPKLRYAYRIYRRDGKTGNDSIAGEVPVMGTTTPNLLDTSFVWEETYDYRATVVTFIEDPSALEQVEGEDTSSLRIVAHDIFPPATPTGLEAAYSGPGQRPFVDLIWNASSEPDFAGYNVYRSETNSQVTKINNDLVKVPAFRDSSVVPGHKYSYSVTAVDVRGNESPASEKSSENVPAM